MQNAPRGAFCITFFTFIKLPFVFKTFLLSIFEWPLKTGFTVLIYFGEIFFDEEQRAQFLPYKILFCICINYLSLLFIKKCLKAGDNEKNRASAGSYTIIIVIYAAGYDARVYSKTCLKRLLKNKQNQRLNGKW